LSVISVAGGSGDALEKVLVVYFPLKSSLFSPFHRQIILNRVFSVSSEQSAFCPRLEESVIGIKRTKQPFIFNDLQDREEFFVAQPRFRRNLQPVPPPRKKAVQVIDSKQDIQIESTLSSYVAELPPGENFQVKTILSA
jgi:hypothetical protein